MKKQFLTFLLLALLFGPQGGCVQGGPPQDDDDSADPPGDISVESLDGDFRCTPAGSGPFSGVLYNHGGLGTLVGGDLEGTCRALAEAGYLAYSKKRRETQPLVGHLDDVADGIDALQSSEGVDPDSLAILGFSRGGLLALQAAIQWPELWSAIVLMAPAPANDILSQTLESADQIAAPVLLQVSENDLFQADHVQLVADVEAALEAAGKPYESILYPPYGDDGHELFWEVQEPYWSDLLAFLQEHL